MRAAPLALAALLAACAGEEAERAAAPPEPRSAVEGLPAPETRSEEHTSELQSHAPISYAVFCLKKKK